MSWTPLAASSSTWCSANGRPATGRSAFGLSAVCGSMRVPRPPARTRTCTGPLTPGGDRAAVVIDGEAHLGQPGAPHRLPQPAHVLGVEQQEASGAGADQLAADRPVVHA